MSPDERQEISKKQEYQTLNIQEESFLSIQNLSSLGSDIKAYQSALSAAIQQDQAPIEEIKETQDQSNNINFQKSSLRIQQDNAQNQKYGMIAKNNQLQKIYNPQKNDVNQIERMLRLIYEKMSKLESDQEFQNHLKYLSLQGNQEEVLGSLLQTLDASEAKKHNKQIEQATFQIGETQDSQQQTDIYPIQSNASQGDTKSRLEVNLRRFAQLLKSGLSNSSQPYNSNYLHDHAITTLNQLNPQRQTSNHFNQKDSQDIRKKYVSLDPYMRVRTIDPKLRAAGRLTHAAEEQRANNHMIAHKQQIDERRDTYVSNKLSQIYSKSIAYNKVQPHLGNQNNQRSTQGSKARANKEGHKSVSKARPGVVNNLFNNIGPNTIRKLSQQPNKSLEYEKDNQGGQIIDNRLLQSSNQVFNTITQKIKVSNNYGKVQGQHCKKIASRQQSRVMSRSALRANDRSSNDPVGSAELGSQILNSNGSQSVGRARPNAQIAGEPAAICGSSNRISLQKKGYNIMNVQVLNKIKLNKVISNRLYQGGQQETNKSQKSINNSNWANQKIEKMQPSITLSTQVQNQHAEESESALVFRRMTKEAQNLNCFTSQHNQQDSFVQPLAENQYVEYSDFQGSQLKAFPSKSYPKQKNVSSQVVSQKGQVKNKFIQVVSIDKNHQSRAFSVQPAFKNKNKLNLEKDQNNNQLASLSSGKLNTVKNKNFGYLDRQSSQNRPSNVQEKQTPTINKQSLIQTGRLRPYNPKNQNRINQKKQIAGTNQQMKNTSLKYNSKASMNNLKLFGMLDQIGEICEVGRSEFHEKNILLGLGMSSQGINNQFAQSNILYGNQEQRYDGQNIRKLDRSQTIEQSKDVVQYQQQRALQNCSQSPDPGVQMASHKARMKASKITEVQGIISDQFSFKNGKMRRINQQNETIDSSNFIMNNRDRKNVQEFLSANNSGVGLYNKFNTNSEKVENNQIPLKMTTGSADIKYKTLTQQQKYEETQQIIVNNNQRREQIQIKQSNHPQFLRFSKASANPLLINDSILKSHLSAAQSQFYQSEDDHNNYILVNQDCKKVNKTNNQVVSESIQKFREKLNQRYQSDQDDIVGTNNDQNKDNQFIQIIKGDDDHYEQINDYNSEIEIVDSKNLNQNYQNPKFQENKNNDNSLIIGSPKKQQIILKTIKQQQNVQEQTNSISSTKKKAIKKLIPFLADDEPIPEENQVIEENNNIQAQTQEQCMQQKPIFIRKHIVQNKNKKIIIQQNEPIKNNIVYTTLGANENSNIETNKINNFDNSKTTICSLNTINASNNPNVSKTNNLVKSNFLFGSNGNSIVQKNVRYSHQNIFYSGDNGQQNNNFLRNLQMKSVAINNNRQNEIAVSIRQNNQPDCMKQKDETNQNLVDDSAVVQEAEEIDNFTQQQQLILSRYEFQKKQNNIYDEEQKVQVNEKKNKGINLLDLSDQITEQYAEEQDQTSTSQSQLFSKMTSRKSTKNLEQTGISKREQKSNSNISNIATTKKKQKISLAQKIELIKSINQSIEYNKQKDNFINQNDGQSEDAFIEQEEINQIHEQIFEKLDKINGKRMKGSNSNFSDPDDVILESIQDNSEKNGQDENQQSLNKQLKNNFVSYNSFDKSFQKEKSKYGLQSDNSININDEDIIHDSGEILAKIQNKKFNQNHKRQDQSKQGNIEFYKNDNINNTQQQQFQEEWPEKGALQVTNRDRQMSNVEKSVIHSDDEVSVRRGLEQSMSLDKLRMLEEQVKNSEDYLSNSQDSAMIKVGTKNLEEDTSSNKVDDEVISDDVNQRYIETSIIISSQLDFNRKLNSKLKVKNAYNQQSID